MTGFVHTFARGVALLALLATGACRRDVADRAHAARGETPSWGVAWRVAFDARPTAPVHHPRHGWFATDAAGGVTALTHQGAPRWRIALTNQRFEAAAHLVGERLVVASLQGTVMALAPDTGATLWSQTLDARFQRPPLDTVLPDQTPILWLVSQRDGTLYCLRAQDGRLLKQSDPTNRCDGEPLIWPDGLAYGNCDGAIHLFDPATGAHRGAITVGAQDQMAGGMLLLAPDALVIGTRQGHLVVVNPQSLACVARVPISESEAFLKPVVAFDGLLAMGSSEGVVSFWQWQRHALVSAGTVTLEQPIDALQFSDNHLFVLAGGVLHLFDGVSDPVQRLALGDEVHGLCLAPRALAACVADGAIVGLKGGSDG